MLKQGFNELFTFFKSGKIFPGDFDKNGKAKDRGYNIKYDPFYQLAISKNKFMGISLIPDRTTDQDNINIPQHNKVKTPQKQ